MEEFDPDDITPEYLLRLADVAEAYEQMSPAASEAFTAKLVEYLRPQTSVIEQALYNLARDKDIDGMLFYVAGAEMSAQVKWAEPRAADMRATENFLLKFLPMAAELAQEAGMGAAELTANPERRKIIASVAGIVKRPEFEELSQWVVVILVTAILMHIFGLLPVENLSPAQDSVDNRLLGVIAIALALAAFVKSRD